MTYPDRGVSTFLSEQFHLAKVLLDQPDQAGIFRRYQVIWTPTLVFLDPRGVMHYQAPGYLPPGPFLDLLRLGLARTMMAWNRHEEAAAHLRVVADAPESPLSAEALYLLGMASYLPRRSRTGLLEAWDRLRREHPRSIWSLRIPQGQDGGRG